MPAFAGGSTDSMKPSPSNRGAMRKAAMRVDQRAAAMQPGDEPV
jgi:hypothetical protein